MKSNSPINPLVWLEIALFIGAAIFLLLGALYFFVIRVILPLF